MRKKDKFIFYLGGIASPYLSLFIWIIAGIIVLSIPFSPLSQIITFIVFPIIGFKYIRKFHRYQLRKYIKDQEQSSKDRISSLAQNWWTLHIVLFPVLLFLLALPSFTVINPYHSESAKNSIVTGIKECVVNQLDDKPTSFKDVRTFSDGYSKLKSFDIKPIDPDTCFKAKAVPTNDWNTWFEIDLNNETGDVSKTCGDSSKPGCNKGNTW